MSSPETAPPQMFENASAKNGAVSCAYGMSGSEGVGGRVALLAGDSAAAEAWPLSLKTKANTRSSRPRRGRMAGAVLPPTGATPLAAEERLADGGTAFAVVITWMLRPSSSSPRAVVV